MTPARRPRPSRLAAVGLAGIHISGTVPVGPIDRTVRIELESLRGTPEGFRPL